MAINPSPAHQDSEPMDLVYLEGLGIGQYLEIAYIYFNKPSFMSHGASLYTSNATKIAEYRDLLANDQCISNLVNLSILLDRPGYEINRGDDIDATAVKYSDLEVLLAKMVHEIVVESAQPKLDCTFTTPVSQDRSDHRNVVVALLCDFLADVVALEDAGVLRELQEENTTPLGPLSESSPTSSSPPPVAVVPKLSLQEYLQRKKGVAGKAESQHMRADVSQQVQEAATTDPRPQKRAKLPEEKKKKKIGNEYGFV